ncbi:MAG TPA: hypothetical protein VJ558_00325 [Bacillales bacterium]|nr:hypothetical protein [Bacillales bacterium]
MLKKLFALFVITIILSNMSIKYANAETPFQAEKFPYKEMQVLVMPEFDYPQNWPKDTPSMLIGQYGTITNNSGQDFDGKIEIPVPANEKDFQISLIAEFPDVNKPEVQRPFEVNKEKGIVTWTPQKPIKKNETYNYVVEYYVNSIEVKDLKSFTYEFKNPADIEKLDVIMYAPMNAKQVQAEPKAQNISKSEYGEDLYYYQYKDMKKGNSLKYAFSYKKENNDSSLSVINKMQPPNDDTHKGANKNSTSNNDNDKQPIIGIGGASVIGIAIVIAGIFIFFGIRGSKNTRKTPPTNSTKSNKNQTKKPTAKKENKLANEEEKKELRKKLLNGKIDQETYEEEMKKLI